MKRSERQSVCNILQKPGLLDGSFQNFETITNLQSYSQLPHLACSTNYLILQREKKQYHFGEERYSKLSLLVSEVLRVSVVAIIPL